MRQPLATFPWRRIVVVLGSLLIAGPLMVSEVYHLVMRGHLGLGLHSDVMSYDDTRGVPHHSLWAVNLTPVPLPVRVCREGWDTWYRWREERRTESATGWEITLSMRPSCSGVGRAGWKIWWPGTSAELVRPKVLARHNAMGHRFRFVVFTAFDRADEYWLQFRVVSDELLLTDTTLAR